MESIADAAKSQSVSVMCICDVTGSLLRGLSVHAGARAEMQKGGHESLRRDPIALLLISRAYEAFFIPG